MIQLATIFRRTVVAAALVCAVPVGLATAQSMPTTAPPEAFIAPQVPADWQSARFSSIDLRLPPGLMVLRDGRDEHVWGEADEKSRNGFGLGIAFSDTPERDMQREDATPDGVGLVLPNGQVFRRFGAVVPPDAGAKGQMEALVSDLPMLGEDRLIVSVMAIGRDIEDYREMYAQFLGSLALPPPGGQLQRDFLGGVVRLPVAPGWSGARDSDTDQVYMFTDALPGRIWMDRGPVNLGSMRDGTPGKPVLFLGEKAQVFAYDEGSETEDDGTGDTGQARLIVLETCLPDGAAITLRFTGMPALFHAPDVAAMVAGGAIVLPEGAAPCAPGVLPAGSQLDAQDARPALAPPFGVAPPGAVQPRAQGSALGGLFTYRLPIGWTATVLGEDHIRFADAGGDVTVQLVRGAALIGPEGLAALVPPGTYHRGTIAFGWPATKFDWPVVAGGAVLNRLIIHDHCLTGNERFGMLVTGPNEFLDGEGMSKALHEVRLEMPDDITACPDPTEGVGVAASPKRAPQEAAVPATPPPVMESAGGATAPVAIGRAGQEPDPAAASLAGTEDWVGRQSSATLPSPATESLAGRWTEGRTTFAKVGDEEAEPAQTPAVEPPVEQNPVAGTPLAQRVIPPPPPPVTTAPAAEPDSFTPMDSGYVLYRNARYGTFILFPATYFLPAPASDSGDGRMFQSVDGTASFYVFAQYNAEGLSQSQQIAREKADPTQRRVTYERAGVGWYVVSGLTGTDIFYRRVVEDGDGLIRVFEITYPQARKADFDAVVTYMAQSFGPAADVVVNQPSAAEQPSANVTEPPVSGLPSVKETASERAEGWWIIVGTFPTDPWQRQKIDFERMQSIAASCNLPIFNDLSAKFRGFTPGYNVFAIGAFESKSIANDNLQQVMICIPDAYVKYGEYMGE